MKTPAVIIDLIACLSWAHGALGSIATAELGLANDGREAVKSYQEFRVLALPAGVKELEWRVRDGNLEFFDADKNIWARPGNGNDFLAGNVQGDWEGFTVGGAPAVGRGSFYEPFTISPEFDFKALAFVGNQVVEIGRRLVANGSETVPELSVFVRGVGQSEPGLITRFQIADDAFQYRLASAFQVSNSVLGILAATEHPDVSSLVLLDLSKREPLGFKPFSSLQYLPKEGAIWIAPPVTKARALADPSAILKAASEAKKSAVLRNGKVDPELANLDIFAGILRVGQADPLLATPTPNLAETPSPASPTPSPSPSPATALAETPAAQMPKPHPRIDDLKSEPNSLAGPLGGAFVVVAICIAIAVYYRRRSV